VRATQEALAAQRDELQSNLRTALAEAEQVRAQLAAAEAAFKGPARGGDAGRALLVTFCAARAPCLRGT